MGRKKIRYFCGECGYEAAKWLGQCPGCGTWNSFSEAPVAKRVSKASGLSSAQEAAPLISLTEYEDGPPAERLPSCSREFDRVLGGSFPVL